MRKRREAKKAPPAIHVVNARTHNLKDVSCRVPLGALTVITGPSGSGKSSLAFDTLYAEGQRRFVESMSTYARQFLERMERPDVDRIDPALPAIAIAQRAGARSARSTVGTATEIDDVLRLLFAAIGETACPDCRRSVKRETPESVRDDLLATFGEGARVLVLAGREPAAIPESRLLALRAAGYIRLLESTGETVALGDGERPAGRSRVVVGRTVLRPDDPELLATLRGAFDMGDGWVAVRAAEGGIERAYHRGLVCNGCARVFVDPSPAHFSFSSPHGACKACEGFGRIVGLDEDRIVPDPSLTLAERPFAPFNTPAYQSAYDDLRVACRRHRVPTDVPWRDLSPKDRALVWDGKGDWYGVKGLFAYLEKKRYKVHVRVLLSRYRGYTTCDACGGARLRPESLAVTVHGRSIADVAALPVEDLHRFVKETPFTSGERERVSSLLPDLARRLSTLLDLGLSYLTLSRQVRTLSGGEAQRIQLGLAIGNTLTGTLYVLDEPTVGLHPSDTDRLLAVLTRLARGGNAVVAVEHDLDVIRRADHVIDLGPAAGKHGGRVVFEGPPGELALASTKTGAAMRASEEAERLVAERVVPFRAPGDRLRIVGARAHNLRNLTVEVPLGCLVGVAGVSGSGKSSLVVDVLHAGGRRALGLGVAAGQDEIGAHDRIEGLDGLSDLVLVSQSPLGRSERSNPATYTKAWEEVRSLYARTARAKERGLTKGSFSFNTTTDGGRCEACEGSGLVSIDMQFLADVTVVCEACDGRRFRPDVLEVTLRGKNVAQLLETTVDEVCELFHDCPRLVARLAPLREAGLGYLGLGQSTSTLSGGESQRLKVASFLAPRAAGRVLFVFDEPTTGLHPTDVDVLLAVFRRLVAAGHSVLAVEHHLGFLAACDHLIELGPGGGPAGGHVVFEGPVAGLVASARTPTGEAFRRSLALAVR